MHQNRFEPIVPKLNSLTNAEVDECLAALHRFCDFALLTFQDPAVMLPRREAVLEIGAGRGYLTFFCDRATGFATRAQIEVTQSQQPPVDV